MGFVKKRAFSGSRPGSKYRSARKRPAYRSIASRRPVARAAQRVANARTGGFAGLEVKYWDTYRQLADVPGANSALSNIVVDPEIAGDAPISLYCLNSPGVGTAANQRDGRRMHVHSITVGGILHGDAIFALPNVGGNLQIPWVTVCVALVLDTQANGSELPPADVFVNPSGVATATDTNNWGSTSPLLNLQYVQRFRVLALRQMVLDGDIDVAAPTFGALNPKRFQLKYQFRGGGLPVNFITSASSAYSTVADISDNALHLCIWQGGPLTYEGLKVTYNARIRFTG